MRNHSWRIYSKPCVIIVGGSIQNRIYLSMKKIGSSFKIVKKEYLDFLRQVDSKVPYNNYPKNEKFFFGVIVKTSKMKYFAPISSFNIPQNTNLPIRNKKGEIKSTIRFSYMIPIPNNDVLKNLDLSKKDSSYVNLIDIEEKFCVKNNNLIVKIASKVYAKRIANIPFYVKYCCDFKALEKKARSYKNKKR